MSEHVTRRGAPKKPLSEKRIERLGVIQLTQQQLADYQEAAKLEGKSKSDWVRDALDAQAKRILEERPIAESEK